MSMESYPLAIGESSMVYEFSSKGINGEITKIIIYTEAGIDYRHFL